ncbi:heterokaryon incompatibility protein [Colletotrichum graminicola M1.001]|uniref:Heterokaryon incompatibility protein n=1 Tax=Colletotrichum graminicola (strain M1.001 / M2 / FGSC 10212) TaxID=645133 RepID=E3QWZ1_COLGM|nr:heterokaryon incompatibility protein [Colletotrichum graminicola M1.001]EFQ35379.1 heterokaryon incompatibility protein [Colletotrichum graminicola M1.001]
MRPGAAPSGIDVLEGCLSSGAASISIHPYAEQGRRLQLDTGPSLTCTAGNPAAGVIRRRPLQRDVQSKRVLSAARGLYKACKESHKLCRYARDTVLPSRVLDLGTTEAPTLRLYVNNTEEHGEYVALSYCWGGNQRGLLRKRTLSNMENGIRLENLQLTVRDAIEATRKLVFRYLWVDALCIIQDCDMDKDKEIAKMAMIYKNAAVTIAAGTAKRATDGFLHMKRTYLPKDKFDVPMPGGGKGTVHLRSEAHVPEHALDERGWVLQEFLLSSRMLIFSEYELLWQCKEVELRGVLGTGLEYLQPQENLPWSVFDEETESIFGDEDLEKRYIWRTIVEQYTLRQLGFKDDRLSALKGITRELETLWRDSNRFGLWTKWFVELLAWSKRGCDGDDETRETSREGRAPTWSWASVNGRVRFTQMFEREDAVFQQVTLLEARVSRRVVLKCRIVAEDQVDAAIFEDDESGKARVEMCYDMDDSIDEVGNRSLSFLLLGTIREDGRRLGVAIMVVEVLGGLFQRVGLAVFENTNIWNDSQYRSITLQ